MRTGSLRRGRAQRLTAIRGKSRSAAAVSVQLQQCSTPYGNQRKITHKRPVSFSDVERAQRLTAIRGKSRVVGPRTRDPARAVLNALRQSEENHLDTRRREVPAKLLCSTPYGNQRKITDSNPVPLGGGVACSTPYGNQRKITSAGDKTPQGSDPCSTPYGNQRKITAHPGILTL